jgi:hypothetical protein
MERVTNNTELTPIRQVSSPADSRFVTRRVGNLVNPMSPGEATAIPARHHPTLTIPFQYQLV